MKDWTSTSTSILVLEVELLLGDGLVVALVLLLGVDVGAIGACRCTLRVELTTLRRRPYVGEGQGVGDAKVDEHQDAVRCHVLDNNVGLRL